MTRWSLFLQTLSLLHHFLGLYSRLCDEHDAYRWVRGGVPINYHMLSDFRVRHQEALDDLLTQIIASLMAAGLVSMERVAQDGMRVRASAGTASFRSKERLNECLSPNPPKEGVGLAS